MGSPGVVLDVGKRQDSSLERSAPVRLGTSRSFVRRVLQARGGLLLSPSINSPPSESQGLLQTSWHTRKHLYISHSCIHPYLKMGARATWQAGNTWNRWVITHLVGYQSHCMICHYNHTCSREEEAHFNCDDGHHTCIILHCSMISCKLFHGTAAHLGC